MIKNLKELYVLDIIEPTVVFIVDNFSNEEVEILKDRICRREIIEGQNVVYRDLEIGYTFEVNDKIGDFRVVEKSIVPLSCYYNVLGIPKINFLDNSKKVRSKVRSLQRQNKL